MSPDLMVRVHSLVVSDLPSETKGFPESSSAASYVYRGELSAVIAQLMSKCL